MRDVLTHPILPTHTHPRARALSLSLTLLSLFPLKKARATFNEMDKDHSHDISVEEFTNWLAARQLERGGPREPRPLAVAAVAGEVTSSPGAEVTDPVAFLQQHLSADTDAHAILAALHSSKETTPTTVVTRDAFASALVEVAKSGEATTPSHVIAAIDRAARALFGLLDETEKGEIALPQLLGCITTLAKSSPTESCELVFSLFDVDNSGDISIAELQAYFIAEFRFHFMTTKVALPPGTSSPEKMAAKMAREVFRKHTATISPRGINRGSTALNHDDFTRWFMSSHAAAEDASADAKVAAASSSSPLSRMAQAKLLKERRERAVAVTAAIVPPKVSKQAPEALIKSSVAFTIVVPKKGPLGITLGLDCHTGCAVINAIIPTGMLASLSSRPPTPAGRVGEMHVVVGDQLDAVGAERFASFDAIDKNGDHNIDFEELKEWCRIKMGKSCTEAEVAKMRLQFDLNGHGTIGLHEFLEVMGKTELDRMLKHIAEAPRPIELKFLRLVEEDKEEGRGEEQTQEKERETMATITPRSTSAPTPDIPSPEQALTSAPTPVPVQTLVPVLAPQEVEAELTSLTQTDEPPPPFPTEVEAVEPPPMPPPSAIVGIPSPPPHTLFKQQVVASPVRPRPMPPAARTEPQTFASTKIDTSTSVRRRHTPAEISAQIAARLSAHQLEGATPSATSAPATVAATIREDSKAALMPRLELEQEAVPQQQTAVASTVSPAGVGAQGSTTETSKSSTSNVLQVKRELAVSSVSSAAAGAQVNPTDTAAVSVSTAPQLQRTLAVATASMEAHAKLAETAATSTSPELGTAAVVNTKGIAKSTTVATAAQAADGSFRNVKRESSNAQSSDMRASPPDAVWSQHQYLHAFSHLQKVATSPAFMMNDDSRAMLLKKSYMYLRRADDLGASVLARQEVLLEAETALAKQRSCELDKEKRLIPNVSVAFVAKAAAVQAIHLRALLGRMFRTSGGCVERQDFIVAVIEATKDARKDELAADQVLPTEIEYAAFGAQLFDDLAFASAFDSLAVELPYDAIVSGLSLACYADHTTVCDCVFDAFGVTEIGKLPLRSMERFLSAAISFKVRLCTAIHLLVPHAARSS